MTRPFLLVRLAVQIDDISTLTMKTALEAENKSFHLRISIYF